MANFQSLNMAPMRPVEFLTKYDYFFTHPIPGTQVVAPDAGETIPESCPPMIPRDGYTIVKPGETVSQVADRLGVNKDDLISINSTKRFAGSFDVWFDACQEVKIPLDPQDTTEDAAIDNGVVDTAVDDTAVDTAVEYDLPQPEPIEENPLSKSCEDDFHSVDCWIDSVVSPKMGYGNSLEALKEARKKVYRTYPGLMELNGKDLEQLKNKILENLN